ncbi:TPA: hypothetical protein ACG7MA_003754, partial [Escherichia coli]
SQKNKRQENSKEGAWFRSSLRGSDNQHVSKSLLQAVDDYMEENSQKNKINIIYTHEEKDKDLS